MPKEYKKVSDEKFLAAIPGTGGLYTVIAKKLGIARQTVSEYVKKNPTLAKAVEEEIESTLDKVESVFINACLAKDIQACMFYLKTKGKSRGYSERIEADVKTSEPISINLGLPDTWG